MAKTRMVNTRFWSDNFVRESLNPLDRYLFLYFLTNEKTNICGVYELPISTIASETGIEEQMLKKMFKRLKGRVDYHEGWVILWNFLKYQNTASKDVQKGIERTLAEIPQEIRDFCEKGGLSIDGLGTVPRQPEEPRLEPRPRLEPNGYAPRDGARGKRQKKDPSTPIVWDEYLQSMEEDKRLHVQLVAYFFKRRGISFDTLGEVQVAISRHSRSASSVVKFGKEKVFKAMDDCDREASKLGYEWSLETVIKKLTK